VEPVTVVRFYYAVPFAEVNEIPAPRLVDSLLERREANAGLRDKRYNGRTFRSMI
jgi:hypothetical protein